MSKGITPVIAVILLLLITISIVGISFTLFSRVQETASQSGEQQLQNQMKQAGAFSIEAVSSFYEVSVRNMGANAVNDFSVYVDNQKVSIEPVSVPAGSIGTLRLNTSTLPTDGASHNVKVTSGSAFSGTADMSYFVLAIVRNNSCACESLGKECADAWADIMKGKNIAVKIVNLSDIDTLQEMQQYKAIMNPYGEWYPETTGTTILDNIREYVKSGGYWFETRDKSFYRSCGPAPDLLASGDDHVCVNAIDGSPWVTFVKDPQFNDIIPNSPDTMGGDGIMAYAPSLNTIPTCDEMPVVFKGLYYSDDRYGPSMHCYGSGCLVRTISLLQGGGNIFSGVATVYADIMRTQIR